jgi:very-short-patch-repair endonuclease
VGVKTVSRLTKRAKALRKSMTKAERLLWSKLRNRQLGVKFRRQQPLGDYIVDFVCFEKKLIIEVDGSQHIDNNFDVMRDNWLSEREFRVLRFWNNGVLSNIEGILEVIRQSIILTPSLSHKREEGEKSQ